MRIAGNATLHAPVEAVYDALRDPRVLVRTIPGCERLEQVGEDAYQMTVTAGVA
ncbi:MAG TPA: SRPBCC domain-containing protein, partial [Actinomycetota bacterium]|nr:SRPBCC domain-containing protein [Actinomycetota bacterium]